MLMYELVTAAGAGGHLRIPLVEIFSGHNLILHGPRRGTEPVGLADGWVAQNEVHREFQGAVHLGQVHCVGMAHGWGNLRASPNLPDAPALPGKWASHSARGAPRSAFVARSRGRVGQHPSSWPSDRVRSSAE